MKVRIALEEENATQERDEREGVGVPFRDVVKVRLVGGSLVQKKCGTQWI